MNSQSFKQFVAGLLIAAQVLPAYAGLNVQRVVDPKMVVAPSKTGNTPGDAIEPVPESPDYAQTTGVYFSVERLDFPIVSVGANTLYYQVRLVNNTDKPVETLNEQKPAEADGFFTTGSCSNKLISAKSACSYQLQFRGLAAGEKNGALAVTVKGTAEEPNKTLSAAVRGFAVAGDLVPSKSSIDFGAVAIGTRSEPNTILLQNKGTQSVSIGNLFLTELDGVYRLSSDCASTTLGAGQSCSVMVDAQPSALGPQVNELRIQNLSDSETISVPLIVAGVIEGDTLAITPDQNEVSASIGQLLSQSYVIRNVSAYDIQIREIAPNSSMGNQAGVSNNCNNIKLQPDGSCVVTASQTPGAPGTGYLGVAVSAVGIKDIKARSTYAILSDEANVRFVPAFNSITLTAEPGQTSEPFQVNLVNSGNVAVDVSDVQFAAPGVQVVSNSCENVTVAADESCPIVFLVSSATEIAETTADMTATTSVGPIVFKLKYAVVPSSLTFGNPPTIPPTAVGKSTGYQVVVSNAGSASTTITEISSNSPAHIIEGSCPATLEPQKSCLIDVRFAPQTTGDVSGTLTVVGRAGQTAQQTVSGVAYLAKVAATPNPYEFGEVGAGLANVRSSAVVIRNAGESNAQVVSVQSDNQNFSATLGDCASAVLAPNQTCSLTLSAQSAAAGTQTAALSLYLAGDAQVAEVLNASAIFVGSRLEISEPLNFGGIAPGVQSAALSATVQNTSFSPVAVDSVSLSGSGFVIVENLCANAVLSPSQSCSVRVAATVAQDQKITGALVVNYGAKSESTTLTAESTKGQLNGPNAGIEFGTVTAGSTEVRNVSFSNSGNGPLQLTGTTVSGMGSEFITVSGCASTLNPGASCQLTVSYSPSAPEQLLNIQVSLMSGQTVLGGIGAVGYSGGYGLAITKSPTTDDPVLVGTNSVFYARVTNSGEYPMAVLSMNASLPGLDASACFGKTLAVGESCQASLAYTAPETSGLFDIDFNATGEHSIVAEARLSVGVVELSAAIVGEKVVYDLTQAGPGFTAQSKAITVQNAPDSLAPLSSRSVVLPNGFTLVGNTCSNVTQGQTCTLTVRHVDNTQAGKITGTLELYVNGRTAPLTITLERSVAAYVTTVTPSTGSNDGGTAVLIAGEGFVPGKPVSVYFGEDLASQAEVIDANTISAVSPLSTAVGEVNVGVSFDGVAQSLAQTAFTYTGPLVNLTSTTSNGVRVSEIDFGFVGVGVTNEYGPTLLLSNQGSSAVSPVSVAIVEAESPFSVSSTSCTEVLAGNGAQCEIKVAHNSATAGQATGTLLVTAGNREFVVTLQAFAQLPTLSFTPTSSVQSPIVLENFTIGSTTPGYVEHILTVTNSTTVDAGIDGISATYEGVASGQFSVVSGAPTTCATVLPAQSSCDVAVRFTSELPGTYTASIKLQQAGRTGLTTAAEYTANAVEDASTNWVDVQIFDVTGTSNKTAFYQTNGLNITDIASDGAGNMMAVGWYYTGVAGSLTSHKGVALYSKDNGQSFKEIRLAGGATESNTPVTGVGYANGYWMIKRVSVGFNTGHTVSEAIWYTTNPEGAGMTKSGNNIFNGYRSHGRSCVALFGTNATTRRCAASTPQTIETATYNGKTFFNFTIAESANDTTNIQAIFMTTPTTSHPTHLSNISRPLSGVLAHSSAIPDRIMVGASTTNTANAADYKFFDTSTLTTSASISPPPPTPASFNEGGPNYTTWGGALANLGTSAGFINIHTNGYVTRWDGQTSAITVMYPGGPGTLLATKMSTNFDSVDWQTFTTATPMPRVGTDDRIYLPGKGAILVGSADGSTWAELPGHPDGAGVVELQYANYIHGTYFAARRGAWKYSR